MNAIELRALITNLRNQKLSLDIAYSLGSFFILAVSGIVINIVIVAARDAAALGIFNLSYAVYITASQIATVGLHYSVLRHSAFYESDPHERGRLFATAAACALGLGVAGAVALYGAESLFARAFGSAETGAAIRNAAYGLALFPLSKVLLAYLNGLRHMKAIAALQSMRYLTIMLLVSAVAMTELPVATMTLCFVVAEGAMLLLGLGYLWQRRLVAAPQWSSAWARRHFAFGSRGLMAGLFVEINSRVDVLMIGFFMNDQAVGIYSFAAMLVDGLYHVLAMVRINFNPLLVAAVRDRQWEQMRRLRAQSQKIVIPVMLVLGLGLVLAYYAMAAWIVPHKGLMPGIYPLLILLAGLVPVSFLVPFDNLMMVSGHPGLQTVQQLSSVGVNVVLAAVLLPVLGIDGAAIGTAFSYVTGIAVLLYFSQRRLGWKLLQNT